MWGVRDAAGTTVKGLRQSAQTNLKVKFKRDPAGDLRKQRCTIQNFWVRVSGQMFDGLGFNKAWNKSKHSAVITAANPGS